ncbi:hypothetical protein SAMN05216534_0143 [Candidatus Aquiluna sp. UB-MaderosW2red]|nr:hypothetical protein SAMN05216534_0143 [Candidatus Aquiluna sp. UB-MaderosW2red]
MNPATGEQSEREPDRAKRRLLAKPTDPTQFVISWVQSGTMSRLMTLVRLKGLAPNLLIRSYVAIPIYAGVKAIYTSILLAKPPFEDIPNSVRFRPFPSVERNLNGI